MADVHSMLKALADPGRLHLARLLGEGAFHVTELVTVLDVPQSTLSRNVHLLLDAGLVQVRREGRFHWYSLRVAADAPTATLVQWVRDHAPALSAEERRRVLAVWEERRARTAAFFDEVDAADPGAAWLGSADCVPSLLRHVPDGAVVADLGAGNGRLLPDLAARARSVIGVDASPSLLDQARRRVEGLGVGRIDLRLGDLAHLPLRDHEADVVVANMVLHHLPEPGRALSEMARVLKPGGVALVGDFLPHNEEWMRDKLADLWLGIEPSQLRAWLTNAGFQDVEVEDLAPLRPGALTVFVARARRSPSTTGLRAPAP